MGLPQDTSELPMFEPPTSYANVLSASFDRAREESTILGAVARKGIASDFAERGKMMSVDDLRERWPEQEWSEEMPDLAAQFKVDAAEENAKRDAIINHGNPGFLKGTVTPFIGSMGAILSDPVETAIGFATAGLGRLTTAAKVAKAGRMGRIASLAKAGRVGAAGKALKTTARAATGTGFKNALVGNLAENTISELFIASGAHAVYEEYTAEEFLQNAIASSLIFTSATSGLGALVSKIGGRTSDNLLSAAEANLDIGKSVGDFLDSSIEFAGKDMEMDATFSKTFGDSFANKIELEEGDNLLSAFTKIKEAAADGKIADVDITDFQSRLDQSGYDMRKMGYADDNPQAQFSDEFIQNETARLKSKESDIGYDLEADKKFESITGEDGFDTRLAKQQEDFAALEVSDPEVAKVMKDTFARVDADMKTNVSLATELGTCILGTAVGVVSE